MTDYTTQGFTIPIEANDANSYIKVNWSIPFWFKPALRSLQIPTKKNKCGLLSERAR